MSPNQRSVCEVEALRKEWQRSRDSPASWACPQLRWWHSWGRVAAKQSWVSLPDPLAGRLSGKAERRRITEALGQLKSPHAVRWRGDGLVTRKRLCLLGANTSVGGGYCKICMNWTLNPSSTTSSCVTWASLSRGKKACLGVVLGCGKVMCAEILVWGQAAL